MRDEYQEWLAKDLVVDTRETWKEWFRRQRKFGETPLIPREELPLEYQPHSSFYNKMINITHGVDPTPPEVRSSRRNDVDMEGQSQVKSVGSKPVIEETAGNADDDEEEKIGMDGVEMTDMQDGTGVNMRPAMAVEEEDEAEPIGFVDPIVASDMKDYSQAEAVQKV